ncbi:MAG: ABC transporter ATP-binding protein [Rhodospirillales bacterium]|nr:ABC transporter ATP-binding protein [Rhodospirillales bacterium]MCB9964936.1 ABC transporter ATP-binding protein [Rhodospirillales bacterium]MCB9973730.1 ABC transporter ATP-binding protein [Rhodospirillales bacterium]
MIASLLEIQNLEKTFTQGGNKLTVLHDVNVSIEPGEIVALVGPSGAGKSTFLQMAGLLDTPTSGKIYIGEEDMTRADDAKRTHFRRELIGFVYQFHYLQPEFSALENVVIPQMIGGTDKKTAIERGSKILKRLGLGHRLNHRPATLSGGEQQRVAISRALANGPSLLLADEPTGNLDPETAEIVFNEMLRLVKNVGIGAIIATHNLDLASKMDRVLILQNGTITQ